jgi:PIN domain nuclease of toxin-antitoxin system
MDLVTNYKLPIYHKDPFDRHLIWEAIQNDFILISVDENMELPRFQKIIMILKKYILWLYIYLSQ